MSIVRLGGVGSGDGCEAELKLTERASALLKTLVGRIDGAFGASHPAWDAEWDAEWDDIELPPSSLSFGC